jgi:hypothetical protein
MVSGYFHRAIELGRKKPKVSFSQRCIGRVPIIAPRSRANHKADKATARQADFNIKQKDHSYEGI